MIVPIGEKKFKIYWRYEFSKGKVVPAPVHHTTCCIEIPHEDGNGAACVYGRAECSPLDRFEKERGRKLTLTRAMKQVPDFRGRKGKEARTAVWNAYLNRR